MLFQDTDLLVTVLLGNERALALSATLKWLVQAIYIPRGKWTSSPDYKAQAAVVLPPTPRGVATADFECRRLPLMVLGSPLWKMFFGPEQWRENVGNICKKHAGWVS